MWEKNYYENVMFKLGQLVNQNFIIDVLFFVLNVIICFVDKMDGIRISLGCRL